MLVAIGRLSNEAILHLLLWSAVVAGLIPVGHAVVRSLPPPSLPARQGPLDRFRTAGSWLLAAAVCAFTYAFGDDSSNALPGIHKSSSLLLWCGVNVVGLLAFSALCTQEARHSVRESWVLRLYWLLMVGSWGAAVVVRSDALASDGLAQHPTNPASLCFYGLAAAVLALGAAYGLFNAQERFPEKRIQPPLRLPPGSPPSYHRSLSPSGAAYAPPPLFPPAALASSSTSAAGAAAAATNARLQDDEDATGDELAKRPSPVAAAPAAALGSATSAAAAVTVSSTTSSASTLRAPLLGSGEEDGEDHRQEDSNSWEALGAFYGGNGVPSEEKLPRNQRECPEVYAGPLSIIYFDWVTPLVKLGFKRPLEQGDLEKLHPSDDPVGLNKAFRQAWGEQLKRQRPSLLTALVKAYGKSYALGASIKFVYDAQQFVGPLLLERLITFLQEKDDEANLDDYQAPPMRVGYELCALLCLNAIIQSVFLHAYFHLAFRTGMRVKAAMITAVYDKALKAKEGAAEMTAATAAAVDSKSSSSSSRNSGRSSEHKKNKTKGGYAALDNGNKAADSGGGGGDNKEDKEKKEAQAHEDEAKADMRTKKKTVGEVVNLMAVDAQRLQDTMSYIAMLWSGIFQIVLSLWYLFSLLGPSVLAGVTIMVLTIPLTSKISIESRARQKRVMNIKDTRIKVENEVLGGMKIIKLYAWERPFMSKITATRDRELHALWKYQLLQVASRVLWSVVPTLVSISTFAVYTLMGNTLTAADAFTSLALFNLLRFPLAMLPSAIAQAVEAGLSLERIRSYLLAPEVRPLPPLPDSTCDEENKSKSRGKHQYEPKLLPPPPPPTEAATEVVGATGAVRTPLRIADSSFSAGRSFSPGGPAFGGSEYGGDSRSQQQGIHGGDDNDEAPRLELQHATFEWDAGVPLLEDVSLSVKQGELCSVVGSTGSGKSGLLAAILGELEPTGGTVTSRGSIAYVAQVAWIQNASLKDNVLFGKAFDAERYAAVVDACCLTSDLAQLPEGDATEIGEKGINLSGGQKQRVAMARAVYADADLYLLDDCLAAVDSQVAHHIFNKCLRAPNMLRDKAVLLVTHNLQLVTQSDTVCLLHHHRAAYVGDVAGFLEADHDLARRCKDTADERASSSNVMRSSTSMDDLDKAFLNAMGDDDSSSSGGVGGQAAAAPASAAQKEESAGSGGGGAAADEPSSKESKPASTEKGPACGGGKKEPSAPKKGDKEGGKLIEKETMMRGSVSWSTYKLYIQAAGSLTAVGGVVGGLLLYNLVAAATNYWLGYWADHAAPPDTDDDSMSEDGEDEGQLKSSTGLSVYAGLSFFTILVSFCAVLSSTLAGQRACRHFHDAMAVGVLKAPMAFFDTTPLGRVVNRFSKDVYTLDEQLPVTLYSWLSCGVAVLVAIATVALVVPWFLAACLPMGWVYYKIMVLYIPTSRELQRLESVTRSPVFSHFGETLEGASTVRAFRAQAQFTASTFHKLEANLRSYYFNVSSNRWLALRLEAIGTGFVTFAAVLAVAGAGAVSGGQGGLALTYALNITQVLNWYVRMSSDRESQIVAVERLQEYAELAPEEPPPPPPSSSDGDHRQNAMVVASGGGGANGSSGRRQWPAPPRDWPTHGKVEFEKCRMRYRPGLPLVLKGEQEQGLTCTIEPGQKVGVVGRTGAGKSSLLLVLLRLVEPEPGSQVKVDGVNVLKMGLEDLRSRVSIIPQDPVLFTGDVRFNVDPFGDHPDAAVWSALDRAHLGAHVATLPDGLASEVEEGGRNFSMGQRQLLCLARALLRASRILLLDEATSAVDHHTDTLVQATIRSEFAHCTVLTIAHRLDTVVDYDRVLVLSDGKLVEDDSPTKLLDPEVYPNGIFGTMYSAHQQGLL